jgi:hypothetical protein
MDKYLLKVKKPENMVTVMVILRKFLWTDFINEKIAKDNVKLLNKLKEIGEEEIYNLVVNDCKNDKFYKNLLFTDAI